MISINKPYIDFSKQVKCCIDWLKARGFNDEISEYRLVSANYKILLKVTECQIYSIQKNDLIKVIRYSNKFWINRLKKFINEN